MAVPDLTFRHVDADVFTTPAHERKPSPFDTSYDRNLERLRGELQHLEATEAVAGLVLRGPAMVRRDGMLRQDAIVYHPGVMLTISTKQHGTLVYSSDQFRHWQTNLRAITVGLHDLRRLERYGIAKRGQQYAGWKELGSGTPMGAGEVAHDRQSLADFLAVSAGLEKGALDPNDQTAIRVAYRTASMHHHPDRGGSHAMMAYLNTARDHLLPEG